MKKWELLELVGEVGAAIFGILGLVASVKRDEDLDDRVRRLMIEDKSKDHEQQNT